MPPTNPIVTPFFDTESHTISYVVHDMESSQCAVIDPVLDIDYAAGAIDHASADLIIQFIRDRKLQLEWLIETHVHADHLSAAPYIQDQLGGRIAIGEQIATVQETFGRIFNEGTEFERDGSQFDVLFSDGQTYTLGGLDCMAIHTPGHTPACMVHVIGQTAFVGDTLFMPDAGSARADFPGGDAAELFDSIQKILALPDETTLYVCHDYGPGGRDIAWQTTVAEQKRHNIHVGQGRTKAEFVAFRTERDAQLAMPALILPSLQVNMRAGEIPRDTSGDPVLKIPLNKL